MILAFGPWTLEGSIFKRSDDVNSQQSAVNSQQSTVNGQQSTVSSHAHGYVCSRSSSRGPLQAKWLWWGG
eukprot:1479129-Lingulodinium_polyedra.AAC.1